MFLKPTPIICIMQRHMHRSALIDEDVLMQWQIVASARLCIDLWLCPFVLTLPITIWLNCQLNAILSNLFTQNIVVFSDNGCLNYWIVFIVMTMISRYVF